MLLAGFLNMSTIQRFLIGLGASLALALSAVACSDNSMSMTAPSQTLNLTGSWVAGLTYSGVTGNMTWTLTQSGTTVTGPVTVGIATGIIFLNGTLNGTLTGTTLAYTITVPSGGLPLQPGCSGQLQGTMTATATTMTGPLSLASSTCSAPIPNQTLTMTKQ